MTTNSPLRHLAPGELDLIRSVASKVMGHRPGQCLQICLREDKAHVISPPLNVLFLLNFYRNWIGEFEFTLDLVERTWIAVVHADGVTFASLDTKPADMAREFRELRPGSLELIRRVTQDLNLGPGQCVKIAVTEGELDDFVVSPVQNFIHAFKEWLGEIEVTPDLLQKAWAGVVYLDGAVLLEVNCSKGNDAKELQTP